MRSCAPSGQTTGQAGIGNSSSTCRPSTAIAHLTGEKSSVTSWTPSAFSKTPSGMPTRPACEQIVASMTGQAPSASGKVR